MRFPANILRSAVLVVCCLFGLAACSEDDESTVSSTVLVIDTMPVSADARLQSDAANSTFGTAYQLCAVNLVYTGGPTVVYRTVLRLPPLPDSVSVSSLERVDLFLYYIDSDTGRTVPVTAYETSNDWAENTVTWNNQPLAESQPFDSARVSAGNLRIDVFPLYVNADSLGYSVMLTTRDGMEQWFHSRETASSGTSPVVQYAYRHRR